MMKIWIFLLLDTILDLSRLPLNLAPPTALRLNYHILTRTFLTLTFQNSGATDKQKKQIIIRTWQIGPENRCGENLAYLLETMTLNVCLTIMYSAI